MSENLHFYVTGSSGGLGVNLVETIRKQYPTARVSCQFNSNAPTGRVFESVNLQKVNVLSEKDISESIEESVKWGGPITNLIVGHGIWPSEDVPVVDMDLSRFKNTLDVNLTGSFLFVKHFLRQLRSAVSESKKLSGPSIVLVGSTAGKFGEAFHTDYSCSKSAMMTGFMLSLKNEVVKIHPKARVNTVAPGWIRTPMAERAMNDKTLLFQALASSPLKTVSEPQDVTNAILFLSDSSISGNITGTCLNVDAGMEGRLLNSINDF